MKIIADSAIPYLKGIFENICDIEYFPGSEITPERVRSADALIVRTRTKCNEQLLSGSRVKVIASATIGTDHIDLQWCKAHNIAVFNAPGCNSGGVLQYFLTALFKCLTTKEIWEEFLLRQQACAAAGEEGARADEGAADGADAAVGEDADAAAGEEGARADESAAGGADAAVGEDADAAAHTFTVGVIGVGNVGSKVAAACEELGFEVLRNDPPKEREQTLAYNSGYLRIKDFKDYYSLDYLLENSDVVTLHVPLDDTTRGLAGPDFFAKMRPGAIFINSSRGEVVDEEALLANADELGAIVLDVWSDEPNINRQLLKRAFITTPHIAGYSAEGKINGTTMAVEALLKYMSENRMLPEQQQSQATTGSQVPAGAHVPAGEQVAAGAHVPAGEQVAAGAPSGSTSGASTQSVHCSAGSASMPSGSTSGASTQSEHCSAGSASAPSGSTSGAAGHPIHNMSALLSLLPEPQPVEVDFRGKSLDEIADLLESIFPIQLLSDALKSDPTAFESLRNNYDYRHELQIL